jgi:RimJ/RimL family protein N-acetyltransferase
VREAEDYVRCFALRHADFVLAFRDDDGKLVAVSAFDRRDIELPLNAPTTHPGWHLQVVALAVEHQSKGFAADVFAQTFEEMRAIATERIFVTATVHRDHRASLAAAARAGLTQLVQMDEHYWVLLGEVPG